MIPFEKAYEVVMGNAVNIKGEYVALLKTEGRFLFENILSDIDIPPFPKSAMDGYACKRTDLDKLLRVIEIIPAGSQPQKIVGQGECSKIMTGARVPDGADCVVMIEDTREENDLIRVTRKSSISNICFQGEDTRRGEVVLQAGARITPAEIAVLASVGCDPVPVARQPMVGVVATGSELVPPFQKPKGVQIRNSNSYQLCAQIERCGCIPLYFGIAEDSSESLHQKVKQALHSSDVVLLSGGVSMGDFDLVPSILKENQVDLKFEKIAIKPGKPTVFGTKGDKFFFGLPGNPVSTFVLFEVLVRPFLHGLMGGKDPHLRVKAKIKETMKRKSNERLEYVPVHLGNDGFIERIDYHGSAHIHAYIKANAIMAFPVGIFEIPGGSEIEVIII